MSSGAVFLRPGQGKSLQVLADRIRMLAGSDRTAGCYEVFERSGAQGSGSPPHSHPWDEAYFILEGAVGISVAERAIQAHVGAFVLASGSTRHTFKILSPSARGIVLTSGPGAGAFFEAMGREIGFPPPSFEVVCQVAESQGLRLA